MMIPKRVVDRFGRSVGKFQQVLKIAKDRDVNESDTVFIIKDMLAGIFGYDKFFEITSEFEVKRTFCDLAIKIKNKVEFLIEAKAIGLELKENHLRQAIAYGANNGVPWVILTNAMTWRVYKIRFEQPINYDLVCSINFSELDLKNEAHQKELFVICKEGLVKAAREELYEKKSTFNRFVLGALILGDEIIAKIRRELRKLPDGVNVEPEEIIQVIKKEVLKHDVLEGDEAIKAQCQVRRFYAKKAAKSITPLKPIDISCNKANEEATLPDELLKKSSQCEKKGNQ